LLRERFQIGKRNCFLGDQASLLVRKTISKCISIGEMQLLRCNFKMYAEDQQCRGDGVGLEFSGSIEAEMRIK